VAVAHKDRASGQFVIDVARGVAPPFDPQQATKDFAALLRDYKIGSVVGDNFAQEWVQAAWRSCNMRYVKSEAPQESDLSRNAAVMVARLGIDPRPQAPAA
jgi:hypothetical protein